jgi:hypothetical protein
MTARSSLRIASMGLQSGALFAPGLVAAVLLLTPACAMEVASPGEQGPEPGDGEAAVASQAASLTNTTYVRRRFIPLRFVQFAPPSGAVVPVSEINEKLLHSNVVFAKAGLQFYLIANHIVTGSQFGTLET